MYQKRRNVEVFNLPGLQVCLHRRLKELSVTQENAESPVLPGCSYRGANEVTFRISELKFIRKTMDTLEAHSWDDKRVVAAGAGRVFLEQDEAPDFPKPGMFDRVVLIESDLAELERLAA